METSGKIQPMIRGSQAQLEAAKEEDKARIMRRLRNPNGRHNRDTLQSHKGPLQHQQPHQRPILQTVKTPLSSKRP